MSLRPFLIGLLCTFFCMPHCYSVHALQRRRQRAEFRGFAQPTSKDPQYVKQALKAIRRSLALHAKHDVLLGRAHYHARLSTLAVASEIGTQQAREAMRIHRRAARAKHLIGVAALRGDSQSDTHDSGSESLVDTDVAIPKGCKVLLCLDQLVKRDSLVLSQELASFNATFGGSDTELEDDSHCKNLAFIHPVFPNGGIGEGTRDALHASGLDDDGPFLSRSVRCQVQGKTDKNSRISEPSVAPTAHHWADAFSSIGDSSEDSEDDDYDLFVETPVNDKFVEETGGLHRRGKIKNEDDEKGNDLTAGARSGLHVRAQGKDSDTARLGSAKDEPDIFEKELHEQDVLHEKHNMHGIFDSASFGLSMEASYKERDGENDEISELAYRRGFNITSVRTSSLRQNDAHSVVRMSQYDRKAIKKDSDTARLGSTARLDLFGCFCSEATSHILAKMEMTKETHNNELHEYDYDEELHEHEQGASMAQVHNHLHLEARICAPWRRRKHSKMHGSASSSVATGVFDLTALDFHDDCQHAFTEPPGHFNSFAKPGFGIRDLLINNDEVHGSLYDKGGLQEAHEQLHGDSPEDFVHDDPMHELQVHETDKLHDLPDTSVRGEQGYVYMLASSPSHDGQLVECVSLDFLHLLGRAALGHVYRHASRTVAMTVSHDQFRRINDHCIRKEAMIGRWRDMWRKEHQAKDELRVQLIDKDHLLKRVENLKQLNCKLLHELNAIKHQSDKTLDEISEATGHDTFGHLSYDPGKFNKNEFCENQSENPGTDKRKRRAKASSTKQPAPIGPSNDQLNLERPGRTKASHTKSLEPIGPMSDQLNLENRDSLNKNSTTSACTMRMRLAPSTFKLPDESSK